MDAASYDRWYETPRGRWIGEREAALVLRSLAPRGGESLLDVGCGTGYFTRALAAAVDGRVAGIDLNPEWIDFARHRDPGRASYETGDARALPYPDASFDLVVSIAALCFVDQETKAVREILRVARRRFAIGLLNRHSLLWIQKGRGGGSGAYRGARWHTMREARRLFRDLPVQGLRVHTAIQLPGGGPLARLIERVTPSSPFGGFMLVVGDVGKAPDG
jgi:SAM-dependent methyltransferase